MSQTKTSALMRTVECCLCADAETRRYFWETMVSYTLLVNQLLELVPKHSKFPEWQQRGTVSRFEIKEILQPLRTVPAYDALPKRFFTSAELLVCYVYKSWLGLQKRRHQSLVGNLRWLRALEGDLQGMLFSDLSLETIQARAEQILEQAKQAAYSQQQKGLAKANKSGRKGQSLWGYLLDVHDAATNSLDRRAICHLLRHKLKVSEAEQSPDELQLLIERKRIEIERLREQLKSQLPKGRDPTGERYLEKLGRAIALPDVDATEMDEEWTTWLSQKQIPLLNPLPYPILFGSVDDLYWSTHSCQLPSTQADDAKKKKSKRTKHPQERIHVRFKGEGLEKYVFRVQCDRRQLPKFRQFASDELIYKQLSGEEKFGMGLFALCSARLIWKEDSQEAIKRRKRKRKARTQQGDTDTLDAPWETHRLYLHCTFDTDLTTKEGTERVRLHKLASAQNSLAKFWENLESSEQSVNNKPTGILSESSKPKELTKSQKIKLKKIQTSIERLQRQPPNRPNQASSYQGKSHIVVGISLSRFDPITAIVFDRTDGKILECQRTKSLLTIHGIKKSRRNRCILKLKREQYQLLHRWRRLRHNNLTERRDEQKRNLYCKQDSESNLGEYLDRLLAARVVRLAMKWQAGTIVLPDLAGIRESVEARIRAIAERRHPKHKKLQEQYAKEYRARFHRWSYGRLVQFISDCAKQKGLKIIKGVQPLEGTEQEKAQSVILSAYQ